MLLLLLAGYIQSKEYPIYNPAHILSLLLTYTPSITYPSPHIYTCSTRYRRHISDTCTLYNSSGIHRLLADNRSSGQDRDGQDRGGRDCIMFRDMY